MGQLGGLGVEGTEFGGVRGLPAARYTPYPDLTPTYPAVTEAADKLRGYWTASDASSLSPDNKDAPTASSTELVYGTNSAVEHGETAVTHPTDNSAIEFSPDVCPEATPYGVEVVELRCSLEDDLPAPPASPSSSWAEVSKPTQDDQMPKGSEIVGCLAELEPAKLSGIPNETLTVWDALDAADDVRSETVAPSREKVTELDAPTDTDLAELYDSLEPQPTLEPGVAVVYAGGVAQRISRPTDGQDNGADIVIVPMNSFAVARSVDGPAGRAPELVARSDEDSLVVSMGSPTGESAIVVLGDDATPDLAGALLSKLLAMVPALAEPSARATIFLDENADNVQTDGQALIEGITAYLRGHGILRIDVPNNGGPERTKPSETPYAYSLPQIAMKIRMEKGIFNQAMLINGDILYQYQLSVGEKEEAGHPISASERGLLVDSLVSGGLLGIQQVVLLILYDTPISRDMGQNMRELLASRLERVCSDYTEQLRSVDGPEEMQSVLSQIAELEYWSGLVQQKRSR